MNNIVVYDICSIFILLILLIAIRTDIRVEKTSNNILSLLLMFTFLTSLSDLIAAVTDNIGNVRYNLEAINKISNYVFSTLHNLLFPIFVMYIYASLDIWYILKKSKVIWHIWGSGIVISTLLIWTNPLTNLVFRFDDEGNYSRGPLMVVIYAIAIFYAVWGVKILLSFISVITRSKFIVMLIAYISLAVAETIQALYPNYLLDSFGLSIALLVYVLIIQRNENLVDPESGAMKYYRAIERIDAAYKMKRPFVIIFIKVTNSRNQKKYLGHKRYAKYLNMQSDEIRKIAADMRYAIDVYYLENGEFAVFADNDDRMVALAFACKVNEYYEESCVVEQLEVIPDACIMVVKCPEDIADANSLTSLAMNYYENFNLLHSVIDYAHFRDDEKYRIKNEMDVIIENGLAENRFEVYYQPIYSTKENRYVSAEALLRLKDPVYGDISPADFIPAAEANGYIHELGNFVIEEVVKFISKNDLESLGLSYIQVNLSATQCIESDLVERITEMFDKYNVEPHMISMELTETAANINPNLVNLNVKRLHDVGIRFALDDYGTGYSNIRRVTSLPFSQVKLDRSFIEDCENPVMWSVINDTISMFKEMGKEILIEGIEKEEVARKFMDGRIDLLQGCDFMQGFYFCKPIPENDFVNFIIKCK